MTSSTLRKIEKHPHSWTFGTSSRGGGDHPCHPPPPATSNKRGGPTLGPMLKSLHRGPKGGVRTPWTPPPPGSATELGLLRTNMVVFERMNFKAIIYSLKREHRYAELCITKNCTIFVSCFLWAGFFADSGDDDVGRRGRVNLRAPILFAITLLPQAIFGAQ